MTYLTKRPTFTAKILLFGEYTLLTGSKALAVPLPISGGKISKKDIELNETAVASNLELIKFAEYLASNPLFSFLNAQKFIEDCNKGISFKSTIPQGYGVGSSGAVVAAIYQKYRIKKETNLTIQKKELSLMESFFHGESSGIDPLVIFQNKSLIINNSQDISIYEGEINFSKLGVKPFLIDTKTTSPTAPLIQKFKETIKDSDYMQVIEEQVNPLVNSIIEQLTTGNKGTNLITKIKKLSKLQLKYFYNQIPPHIIPIWEEGLKSDAFYLKLCGSGGGGYMLGFTKEEVFQ